MMAITRASLAPHGLSYGVVYAIVCLAVLFWYSAGMRQTDRGTDGQTDRQTHEDSIYRGSIASRDKNHRSRKVIGIATIKQAIYHFLLVVCSNNDSILYRFRVITTFTSTSLSVTFRSPSFSKRQLKLQATCAFRNSDSCVEIS